MELELTYPTCSEKMDIMLITDIDKINNKLDHILETRVPALKQLNNDEGVEELTLRIKLLKYSRSKQQPIIIKKNKRVSTPINIPELNTSGYTRTGTMSKETCSQPYMKKNKHILTK